MEKTGAEAGVKMAVKRKGRRVMVGMDESKESTYALQWLLNNLLLPTTTTTTTTNPTEVDPPDLLTLVHVISNLHHDIYPLGPVGYTGAVVTESMKKAQQERASAILDNGLRMVKASVNVKTETLILEGDAKDMLCQATEDMHMDLLVVGSRGLGRIKRAFLGSVSDYCAHHASCPLLIVKPLKESPSSPTVVPSPPHPDVVMSG